MPRKKLTGRTIGQLAKTLECRAHTRSIESVGFSANLLFGLSAEKDEPFASHSTAKNPMKRAGSFRHRLPRKWPKNATWPNPADGCHCGPDNSIRKNS
jgi:hypothetical protein